MQVRTHEFTHVGRMQENEDRMKVLPSPSGDGWLLVVADGLGGHGGGSLAAQAVIETAERCWRACAPGADPEAFLRDLANQCHKAVNVAGESSGLAPRSTLAALLVRGARVTSAHAGDSRVMQFGQSAPVKRTVDHSLAQLSVLRGSLTEAEAANHPQQKILFSHIGGPETPHVEIERWNLAQGRRFVLCTDGFWELFTPAETLALFESADPVQALSAAFTDKLSHLERHDNTTVILAEIESTSQMRYWLALFGLALAGLAAALVPSNGVVGPQSRAQAGAESARAEGMSERRGSRGRDISPTADDGYAAGRQHTPAAASSATPAGGTGVSQDGGPPETPISLGSVSIELNRKIEAGSSVSRVAADELRKRGLIGDADTLEPAGKARAVGGKTLTRLQQEHEGTTVLGAQVVVTGVGNRIVLIRGQSAPDIETGTSVPNDYATTISIAARTSDKRMVALDKGSLVIVRRGTRDHRLGWEGSVLVDNDGHYVVLDSETGEILMQLPLAVE